MMQWALVIDFALVSVSLLLATVLRANCRLLQRFLVPNAITAGFIGLALMYLVELLMPDITPSREVLGNIVYHLLAITFISIALKKRERYIQKNSLATAFHLTLGYAVEGFVGYTITLILLYTVMPDIFPTFGMLFEMGFGQSSGQAYALGKQWEALGFTDGGTVGLTFGAIGFLWACFVGIPLLNWGVRKGLVSNVDPATLRNRGFFGRGSSGMPGTKSTTHPDVISSGAFHIAVVGSVYFLDYALIKLLVFLLHLAGGEFSVQFGKILWAYHAFFATLLALLVGKLLDKFRVHHVLDDRTLTAISASSVDFLVTSAIMAIEIVVIAQYIVPILIICIAGGSIIMLLVFTLARKSFDDHLFERIISIFGLLTGTVSTGLALLRVIDPDYSTPAASDLVLGSGFSLFLGFPLLFLINLPALNQTTRIFVITDVGIAGYGIIVFAAAVFLGLVRLRRR